MRERIMEYLQNGITADRLPSILGISAAYINSVIALPEFKEELTASLEAQTPEKDEKRLDVKYAAVEHELLNEIGKKMQEAELPALTMALRTIADIRNKANFSGIVPANGAGIYNTIVNVTLPAHALPAAPVIQLNSQAEILSINETSLAPLSSEGVRNLFASRLISKGIIEAKVIPKLNSVPEDF